MSTEAFELTSPELYLNRELSILDFNMRVLEQATDPSHPLIERLNFLLIFSRNLDEFFEIRVAGLLQQVSFGHIKSGPDGLLPQEVLKLISDICHAAVERQYRILNEDLLPALAAESICYLRRDEWTEKQSAWVRRYFKEQVLPVLTPIGLDPAHPFPRLVNKSLNFIVSLDGKDAFGRQMSLAVVPAPRSLPRVVRLPDDIVDGGDQHVMLSSIIHEHVSELFPGMTANGCFQFRVTRNADMTVDEDAEDLASALKGELLSRRYGAAVRLEVADNCPRQIIDYLLRQFSLTNEALYQVNGPVNLSRLLTDFDRPRLRFTPFRPRMPDILQKSENIFETIAQGDILLHHPFESFMPVIDLLRQAARDPHVLAIKQTLYRSGPDSEIVNVLADAARNGKEVTAVIELRARFDEASNIEVANKLQQAGAIVVYGIVGYKTHAKMILVVRREGRKLMRYGHLGTGNYHAGNARLYTDYGLLTANQEVCEDIHKIFQELTGMGKVLRLKQLLHAPFTLHPKLLGLIEQEIKNQQLGVPARIIIKVNALTEQVLMQALMRASQAGVSIDLIIRSVCCLRPGVAGVTDNIRVRSIVGRFLEHTRVFYFENAGEPLVYGSSADWMDRNLYQRVETCFPFLEPGAKKRVIEQGLMLYLKDNTQAWDMQPDGSWQRATPGNSKPCNAQQQLLEKLT
ncbi:polyphosphate kinase [Paraperlucidibaca baekdonensis]|uniref:Polyphosphate kinase n=1 Tax=Paraperlucidibaca baekdonensis TaxID=748120 RepID=A0A3E0H8I6_9GAMM|nr:polyphosphate kinase 1 [Paraperlucidibaca baekdonensis]REH40049.1 polyphosphate kinase [Paraperlucidibaca baekdonensis]